jgi:hypothetical protein
METTNLEFFEIFALFSETHISRAGTYSKKPLLEGTPNATGAYDNGKHPCSPGRN